MGMYVFLKCCIFPHIQNAKLQRKVMIYKIPSCPFLGIMSLTSNIKLGFIQILFDSIQSCV